MLVQRIEVRLQVTPAAKHIDYALLLGVSAFERTDRRRLMNCGHENGTLRQFIKPSRPEARIWRDLLDYALLAAARVCPVPCKS